MSLYVWKSFATKSNMTFGATIANSKEEAISSLMQQFEMELNKVKSIERQLEGSRVHLWVKFSSQSSFPPSNCQRVEEYNKLGREVLGMLQKEEPVIFLFPCRKIN